MRLQLHICNKPACAHWHKDTHISAKFAHLCACLCACVAAIESILFYFYATTSAATNIMVAMLCFCSFIVFVNAVGDLIAARDSKFALLQVNYQATDGPADRLTNRLTKHIAAILPSCLILAVIVVCDIVVGFCCLLSIVVAVVNCIVFLSSSLSLSCCCRIIIRLAPHTFGSLRHFEQHCSALHRIAAAIF